MLRFLVPLAFALALCAPAIAQECVPSTTLARICPVGSAPGLPCAPTDLPTGHYVDEDGCPLVGRPGIACDWTVWVYEESNGIDGLQRHDDVVDDTCGGRIPSDTIIF